jgi:hypothetical protein
MRKEPNLRVDPYRTAHPKHGLSPQGANYGYFEYRGCRIISSGVDPIHGWEHVSVSKRNWTPTWQEMEAVKQLFWGDRETVIQFHPKKSEYVNIHKNCLHLWKKTGFEFQLPPQELV